MISFSTWIHDCYSHSFVHFGIFLSFDRSVFAAVISSPFGNLDHVAVSV